MRKISVTNFLFFFVQVAADVKLRFEWLVFVAQLPPHKVELVLCPLRSVAATGLSLTSAQGRSPRGDCILPRAPRAPSRTLLRLSSAARLVVDFSILFFFIAANADSVGGTH